MNRKFIPYVVILILTTLFAMSRIFILYRDWSWSTHLVVFLMQLAFLIGVWHFIKALNDFLEKRIPYEKGLSKRIIIQTLISLLVLSPFMIAFIYLTTILIPGLITRFRDFGISLLNSIKVSIAKSRNLKISNTLNDIL